MKNLNIAFLSYKDSSQVCLNSRQHKHHKRSVYCFIFYKSYDSFVNGIKIKTLFTDNLVCSHVVITFNFVFERFKQWRF